MRKPPCPPRDHRALRHGGPPLSAEAASTRERIRTAVQGLFAEQGFDATPTSRIAERAGAPKGLVHSYFRRKPELLVALIERLREIRAVMRAALPGSRGGVDVPSAAKLLVLAVSYRHSTARHAGAGFTLEPPLSMHRELDFLAQILVLGAGTSPEP